MVQRELLKTSATENAEQGSGTHGGSLPPRVTQTSKQNDETMKSEAKTGNGSKEANQQGDRV
jgi:hypothetical protein